jgi:hypothetical protein
MNIPWRGGFIGVLVATLLSTSTVVAQENAPLLGPGSPVKTDEATSACALLVNGPVPVVCHYEWQRVGQSYQLIVVAQNPTPFTSAYRIRITHTGELTEFDSPDVSLGYLQDAGCEEVPRYCTEWTVELSGGQRAYFTLTARTFGLGTVVSGIGIEEDHYDGQGFRRMIPYPMTAYTDIVR